MASTQYDHLLPPAIDSALIFSIRQLIQQYSFLSHPRCPVLANGVVTWQAIGVLHILEDNVVRITQYVEEHCLDDNWHLGNMAA